ncbi:hypothetical protein [Campylobacter sp.]|uniref:hypothetical protein n=1 Tax=Campylobacter sp. TaxID=205 RepID=UPI0026DA7A1C|nr:hypothetical protein [Campylobacter sp.]MDO4674535.1 hypothetical protein [Campylobacter sp.]
MKKLIAFLFVFFYFSNFVFAGDFLAKVSNGVLRDASVGVKKLSFDEMKEVKGGYRTNAFL